MSEFTDKLDMDEARTATYKPVRAMRAIFCGGPYRVMCKVIIDDNPSKPFYDLPFEPDEMYQLYLDLISSNLTTQVLSFKASAMNAVINDSLCQLCTLEDLFQDGPSS